MNPNHLHNHETENSFSDLEKAYIKLRDQEGRLYSDATLSLLPEYPANTSLSKEWAIRKASMQKLLTYLQKDTAPQELLDLACGNGWLSNALASIKGIQVTGVDINQEELHQAMRVFQKDNLSFEYGDIFSAYFSDRSYNKIVIAAAVQYFPDFSLLIKRLMSLLKENGEIHIIDSPFYTEQEALNAKKRTASYYTKMGAEAMIPYYHHHQWSVLNSYDCRIVKPSWLKHVISKAYGLANPFAWIIIQKHV